MNAVSEPQELAQDASQIVGISHKDRMISVGIFVILVHAAIILGITFSAPDNPAQQGPTFAVTLVQSRSAKAPKHANYIAQANQIGEGHDHAAQPAADVSQPAVVNRKGKLNARDHASQVAPAQHSSGHNIATTRADARHVATNTHAPTQANRSPRFLIARLMTQKANTADPTQRHHKKAQAPGDNPDIRTIAVNTTESRFARYLNAWRQQVTRMGNLNYPQAIRSRQLSGRLRLQVTLSADGHLVSAKVVRPSKHSLLNKAALSIVRSGAPYPPFPPAIRKDTTLLRFVYEWRFIDGQLGG